MAGRLTSGTGGNVADVVIVGAGAAGLMTAITAGRRARGRRIVLVDGARSLGAKILVAGGGRCNVTHDVVSEADFAGSTPAAIRKVLRRFPVEDTVAFFRELGVVLKREETGKLFPVTDRARTVLDALVGAVRDAGVEIAHPWRVTAVRAGAGGFVVTGPAGEIVAERVVLATGGKSLPKSGSDGAGLGVARSLGHSVTPLVVPALVPLQLEPGLVQALSGVTLPAALELRSATGARLVRFEGSTLLAHFGLSGPPVLDLSRHWIHAAAADPGAHVVVSWLPRVAPEQLDHELQSRDRATAAGWLARRLPERLARALAAEAGAESVSIAQLSRESRRALVRAVTAWPARVTGHRGWNVAEATAGGVPLSEVRLETLESRVRPGLFLAGELLDVDGRIGGYNFQWAWASGLVAGSAA